MDETYTAFKFKHCPYLHMYTQCRSSSPFTNTSGWVLSMCTNRLCNCVNSVAQATDPMVFCLFVCLLFHSLFHEILSIFYGWTECSPGWNPRQKHYRNNTLLAVPSIPWTTMTMMKWAALIHWCNDSLCPLAQRSDCMHCVRFCPWAGRERRRAHSRFRPHRHHLCQHCYQQRSWRLDLLPGSCV